MLAACILFHALELAKIAKLPKQEDDEVSDVEYMSAEDRAQSGISATSNRNAGIVHTKKKYNDTLPVGYMEVLEKFIPEEALPHIFDRFYRVDKARSRETGGTGLGLSITKQIILLHFGVIKAESKVDEGTTFTVRIPLKHVEETGGRKKS